MCITEEGTVHLSAIGQYSWAQYNEMCYTEEGAKNTGVQRVGCMPAYLAAFTGDDPIVDT